MKTIQSIYLHNITGPQQVKMPAQINFFSAAYSQESNGFSLSYEIDSTAEKKEGWFNVISDSDPTPEKSIYVASTMATGKARHIYWTGL